MRVRSCVVGTFLVACLLAPVAAEDNKVQGSRAHYTTDVSQKNEGIDGAWLSGSFDPRSLIGLTYPYPVETITKVPTKSPTKRPTKLPTAAPTKFVYSVPTNAPTKSLITISSKAPIRVPTKSPVSAPTKAPVLSPVNAPTGLPTRNPTRNRTKNPTKVPSNAPIGSQVCTDFILDFETRGDGSSLTAGSYVRGQWLEEYGLDITAMGALGTGFTPGNRPRLFDSSNPGTEPSGDQDLGSPNNACLPSGGPGVGLGGVPGSSGENCAAQGLVLIIQENDAPTPDDNASGGMIKFGFINPVDVVYSIGLMDIDNVKPTVVAVTKSDGQMLSFVVPVLGDNSLQTVAINVPSVTEVKVTFGGSGAITALNLCIVPFESLSPALAPPSSLATATPSRMPINTPAPIPSPTSKPTGMPTRVPTSSPTLIPTNGPTSSPTTKRPTRAPSSIPTNAPTKNPTNAPTGAPTSAPTSAPTKRPTRSPTGIPTNAPTNAPTSAPTDSPTKSPTSAPTSAPTKTPTRSPTGIPTNAPTNAPTSAPTGSPTKSPTSAPTSARTKTPTRSPTGIPTSAPTNAPAKNPTKNPTRAPTKNPTRAPTKSPINNNPTKAPPTAYSCVLPNDMKSSTSPQAPYAKYSLITKGNANVGAHNIYSAIAVGGVLTHVGGDGSQTTNLPSLKINSNVYYNQVNSHALSAPNPDRMDFGNAGIVLQTSSTPLQDAGVDFGFYEWLALHVVPTTTATATGGSAQQQQQQQVFVVDQGSQPLTTDLEKYIPGGQGSDRGNNLVIFKGTGTVSLTQSPSGRQFGPIVIAPFATVDLKADVGYIEGFLVAKDFTTSGSAGVSTPEMHGYAFQGTLTCKY